MYTYTFADFTIAVGLPLPELSAAKGRARYRIGMASGPLVSATRVAAWHHWRDAAGVVNLSLLRDGRGDVLLAPGLAQLRVDGDLLTLSAESGVDEAAVRHTLLNQFLPRVLDRDGELMLHAGVVADPGKPALVWVGESRFGKSTLAAAFARAGARLLTDDGLRLALDGTAIRAIPTYPNLRLREDSRTALCAGADPARHLGVRATASPETDCAIGALVVLNAPGVDADIILQPLSPGEAAMALVQNSFALDPNDLQRARQRLGQVASVAAAVPAYRLGYPRNYARLPEVVARLRALPL